MKTRQPSTAPKTKKLVNNVIFVIDSSSSMDRHARAVNQVINDLIKPLSATGYANQQTRVSLYTFNDLVTKHKFLVDPVYLQNFSLIPQGYTALIDATYTAIAEHQILERSDYEDNTFLLYVITDGEENRSRHNAAQLRQLFAGLNDSWTLATMVPNQTAVHHAKNFGFPAGNIEVWDISSDHGFEEVGRTVSRSYSDYTNLRSQGIRSSSNLFHVNANNISTQAAKANLQEDYTAKLYPVNFTGQIREVVESVTGRPYILGDAFYELMKKETVQPQKEIAIVHKRDGKKYFGRNARIMLGLPQTPVKVIPGDFGDWRLFVQSTSVNRKVVPGTALLIRS
jgi:uncharacterized protein YegL